MLDWYVVENQEDIDTFLDMFWGLHDFRITDISYDPKTQQAELKLQYDINNLRVKLLFLDVTRIHITANDYYECSWLDGAHMRLDPVGVLWLNCDDVADDELPDDVTWVKAKKMLFAYTNDQYEPIPLPDDMLHQVWRSYDYEKKEYEESNHDFAPRRVEKDSSTT